MCWLTAYTIEQWEKAAAAAGVEVAGVVLIDNILNAMEADNAALPPAPLPFKLDDFARRILAPTVAAMDIPPAEPAQVFDYARQEWVTPGAVEPAKPEPCAIVPAVEEYSTIGARLREIAEEKRAAMSTCEHCEGAGWVRSSVAMYANVWVVCGECLNALDRPQPG